MVSPMYVRYSSLKLTRQNAGAAETLSFECSSTNIGVTSDGGDSTALNTLCPSGSFSEVAQRTYSLAVTAVQDVEDVEGLLWFAWRHEGETWEATYYPKTDAAGAIVGNGLQGTVTVQLPAQIGNVESGNYATTDLVWPFQGRPVLVDSSGVDVPPVTPPTTTVAVSGVTAGTPGTFSPANATVPANLAALTADPVIGDTGTNNPTTAWLTGESVTLADASSAHWNGTNWIAGVAP